MASKKRMKDSTRDTIVKVLIMYRKKANIAFFNKPPWKKKSLTEIIFSIYTRHTSKIFSKLIVSLIWSQKLEDSEA